VTDPVRDEAERLVAAAIAAVSLAAQAIPSEGPHAFSTGSDACCVCPICRLIAALRDPSPEMAERLATGAGDLASGVTSMLRAFGRPASAPADEAWAPPAAADEPDPWRAATTTPAAENSPDIADEPPTPRKAVAKKAVKKAVKKAAPKASAGDE
jgi:hypothetical protein